MLFSGLHVSLLILSTNGVLLYTTFATAAAGLLWFLLWLFGAAAWVRGPVEECPRCGSKDFRKSQTLGLVDRARKLVGVRAFRCRGCTRRFPGRTADASSFGRRLLPHSLVRRERLG